MILSPDYSNAQYIFPFLCFYPLMMTVSETTNLGIVFLKRSSLNILVSLISLAVSVGLNFWLVPIYGATGAAVATGSAYIAFFLARTYFSMRIWKGFSVKRHLVTTAVLFAAASLNMIIRDTWLISILNTITLILILLIYVPLVQMSRKFVKTKHQKNRIQKGIHA
ncbi:lipopolysaccharide biosynthesis protein [Listeria fleischmannii]|nr:polysaccharide biosynthesis C-terminal domain-containing protein [Listeria fleischmannii]